MDLAWFSRLVDGVLSDNDRFKAITVAIFVAYFAVSITALVRRRIGAAIPAIDVAFGLVVVSYIVSNPASRAALWESQDPFMAALAGLELAAFAVGVCALGRARFAGAVAAVVFGLHALASAGAVLFVLTFKIDRLI